ncbi:hypothetical protein ENSA5_27220 [Enhygromyxa salina]|uniref:DUF1641 domain-containing protein n=1 Tax=Enhygromyxa salina TaxID=215803 RepID=A0A2S9Y7F5_9BACT|nr:DUF1641 domain-containing protein [Enhygromyxa salina]PRQ01040.1 hypothetical protein ENSA5_27220 [Enhygromyxa salina]
MANSAPRTPTIGGSSQLDRIEAQLGRIETRLERADPLLAQLPGLLATFGNTIDDIAGRDGEVNFDLRLRRALAVIVKLGDPGLLEALERLLEPETMAVLADAGAQLPSAAADPGEARGVFGLVGVLREPEVQRATSFLIHFARRLGRTLDARDSNSPGAVTEREEAQS